MSWKKCKEFSESKVVVTELSLKKRGRILLLGNELDEYVTTNLHYIQEKGGAANTVIAIACAEGIIISWDSNLLPAMEVTFHLQRIGLSITENGISTWREVPPLKQKSQLNILNTSFLLDIKWNSPCFGDKVGPNGYKLCTCIILDNGKIGVKESRFYEGATSAKLLGCWLQHGWRFFTYSVSSSRKNVQLSSNFLVPS